jgi:probable rRNA maturation factor
LTPPRAGCDLLNGNMNTKPYTIDVAVDEAFIHLVDQENLAAAVAAALRAAGRRRGAVTVAVTDDATIQQLNCDYRGVDAPTDVLSFGHQENGNQALALPPELAAELADYLGDIIIAYPYAERQAAQFQNAVAAELRLLAVHGVLHLLGYDHVTADQETAMWALQDAILAGFGDPKLSQRNYDA